MGNYKFKLSDMMPNAWFYKLRDMSKPKINTRPIRNKQLIPSYYPHKPISLSHDQPRHATYYHHNYTSTASETETETPIDKFCTSLSFINTHFLHPPRKSSSKRKSIHNPSSKRTASVSTHCNCRGQAIMPNSALRDNKPRPTTPVPYIQEASFSSPDHEFYGSHRCRITASSNDIIIHVDGKSFSKKIDTLRGGTFQYEPDSIIPEPEPEPEPELELELPPILTKPIKFKPKVVIGSILEQGRRDDEERKTKKKKKKSDGTTSRRSTGIKLRANSPRIANKKTNQIEGGRRSTVWPSGKKQNLSAESFAIVKSSFDPETDFKDSMVEMIIENNIRASKDLEELLAVYLSLNSDEYHDLIVKAFEQIWFDMADLRL